MFGMSAERNGVERTPRIAQCGHAPRIAQCGHAPPALLSISNDRELRMFGMSAERSVAQRPARIAQCGHAPEALRRAY